ncbi:hypothetical protein GCM10027167_33460 [Nocardia heshunensis]
MVGVESWSLPQAVSPARAATAKVAETMRAVRFMAVLLGGSNAEISIPLTENGREILRSLVSRMPPTP